MKIKLLFLFLFSQIIWAQEEEYDYDWSRNPFYLQFDKMVMTGEPSQARLDISHYSKEASQLFTFRVLKPKNPEAFLDSLASFERGRAEAKVGWNPAHYFVQGLNKVDSLVPTLRKMLHSNSGEYTQKKASQKENFVLSERRFQTPQKTVVNIPEGFEVLHEWQKLASGLIHEGGDPHFMESSSYKHARINVPALESGLYILQVVSLEEESQVVFQVNPFAISMQQSYESVAFHGVEKNGKPLENFEVEYRLKNKKETWKSLKVSVKDGLAFYEGTFPHESFIRVKNQKGEFALLQNNFLPMTSENSQSLFLFTDRPMYKPGETVYAKGILREKDGFSWKTNEIPPLSLKAFGKDGKMNEKSQTASFFGEFHIPEDMKPDVYPIEALSEKNSWQGQVRVKDYIKPLFFIEGVSQKGSLLPGNTFELEFKVEVPSPERIEELDHLNKLVTSL